MKQLVLLSILVTFLYAQNPNVYSSLGNVIYGSLDAVDKLKKLADYKQHEKKIDKYIENVLDLKKYGFAIDSGDYSIDKHEYLSRLRKIFKTYDYFVRNAKRSFKESIQTNNTELFTGIINSGLIDTDIYKKDILNYYLKHSDELDSNQVIVKLRNKDSLIKKHREVHQNIEADAQKAKIKRIRKKDKRQDEAFKKLLEEELLQKKKEIRENQKKELFGS